MKTTADHGTYHGMGGITKGQAVTYTLSDGKKIQKVTDVVTGTGSVVRAVSFQSIGSLLRGRF